MTAYSWFNLQNKKSPHNHSVNTNTTLEFKDFSHCWPTATLNEAHLNIPTLTKNKITTFNYPTMAKIN